MPAVSDSYLQRGTRTVQVQEERDMYRYSYEKGLRAACHRYPVLIHKGVGVIDTRTECTYCTVFFEYVLYVPAAAAAVVSNV